ncbi:amino acid adenylation domain-containing protein [Flavobacterium endoglycinae]|uniref:Amino acid adenylation domain-containing protein n=1 Tax=Flavobacterium endoglycinae TaxID=2816357 RepID=A0ABX7QBP2_9FLAO|nr:non-ribosomal peptide synthetase [Flavobacterium endoglycinae]QSW88372.1 amino acid adenylation domain-containing protein [Flavobacterium endoglycinae]
MAHSIKNLLGKLREKDIFLKVNNNKELEITVKQGKIPSDLVEEIKLHKKDIITYLESSENKVIKKIEKAPLSDSYVTSSAQKSLWIVSQDEIASAAYNIPSYKLLEGIQDIVILNKAVKAVIDRHEILRTVFKTNENGEVRQFVLDSAALNLNIQNIDFRGSENWQTEVFEYIQNDSYKPFDLEKGPLLRIATLQTADQSFYFYYNLHHIISDGWSNDILEKEVLTIYNSYLENRSHNLPELHNQYKDYAVWENAMFENGQMENYKKFWIEKLAGDIPRINLPSSKQRPKLKTYNGQQFQGYIAKNDLSALKENLQKEGGTLFMSIIAVLKILLFKYTNERDITIGFPIVNRDDFNLQNQIGYYIKPLALRDYIDNEDTFNQFYQKLKENTFAAFNNKEYPFQMLVNDLQVDYDPARSPLFDISLTFHNISEGHRSDNIDSTTIQNLGESKCKQDIEFHFQETGEYLSFMVNFNKDVYESEMIVRFMQHFKQLLAAVVKNPNVLINDLNYLTDEEKFDLVYGFNQTEMAFAKENTLVSLFKEQAQKTPDTTALVFEDISISYKELDQLSDRLASKLVKEYNIITGDYVGIQLNRSEWSIISILGVLKAGGVYVPVDAQLPEDRKAFIFEDADFKLLITETLFLFDLNFYDGTVFSIDVEFDSTEEIEYQQPQLSPQDTAYVIYTSGSTGNPKGVIIEHAGIVNTILSQIDIFGLKDCSNSLQFASFSFDASISEIFIALLSGCTLYVMNDETRLDVKLFEKYIVNHKIDIATLTPAYFKLVNIESLKDLKFLITAGESAVYDKVQEYLKFGTFYNAYGPTETSICATILKVEKGSQLKSPVISIGKPIANTAVYILDASLTPSLIGVTGEIYIGGAGLAKGYLNRPDLTADKFIPNPFKEGELMYRSGDLGKWLSDGTVEFVERIDDQVKIRGHRVELGEIENHINAVNGVKHSVVAVKEKDGEKSLVAYYVTDSVLDKKNIQSSLVKVLPDYMLPAYYVELKSIPLNINGKVDKKALPDVRDADLIKTEYVPAESTEEKVLVSVWEEILKCNNIGIKDNFYSLGGDSIKAISIISRLKQKGYLLKIEYILKNPVIEDLAKFINQNQNENTAFENEPDIVKEEKKWTVGDAVELSPNQKRFYKMKYSAVTINFNVPYKDVSQFENEFRKFLSHFPNLTVRYEEINGTIFQRYITAEETKIKVLANETTLTEEQEIYKKAQQFLLEQPFNLTSGELIRVFVVPSPVRNETLAAVAIHHSLADAYTTDTILKEAVSFFQKGGSIEEYHHPFEFITQQQEYLNTEESLQKRASWTNYLQKQVLVDHISNTAEKEDYVDQELIISGKDFKKVQELSTELNLPLSALFNAFFLMILNKAGNENKKLYQVFINNREQKFKGLETAKILGVIDNVLIRNYFDSDFNLSTEFITNNYLQYLNDRIEETIPYETIREDFRNASGIDLDTNIIGFLNFLVSETEIANIDFREKFRKSNSKSDAMCDLSLVCNQYLNGIILKLVSKKTFYEENETVLSLEKYTEEFLDFINECQSLKVGGQV